MPPMRQLALVRLISILDVCLNQGLSLMKNPTKIGNIRVNRTTRPARRAKPVSLFWLASIISVFLFWVHIYRVR